MKITAILLLLCLAVSPALAQKSREIKVTATFYGASSNPSGTTATGRDFDLPGLSVDPNVIPHGSRVYVPGFGTRIADDTDRWIKGRRINVRMPLASRSKLRRLGKRHFVVTVTPPKRKRGK
jgi:3D (Asp-Asp-Asp) domain-containing protein